MVIMIKFAVHHVFDTLDDNEHYYFSSYADALELFNQIKSQIERHLPIVELYTDEVDEFYVHLDDGLQKVYIQDL
jgi:hypothetical protein